MEEQLKNLIEKAAEVVTTAEISEDIKPVAFAEVLRYFIQANIHGGLRVKLTKNVFPKSSSGTVTRKYTAEKRNNPSSLINKMIDSGYFKIKRKYDECKNELQTTGFNIPPKQLATVLLRKVRGGSLKRELTGEGTYLYFSV